MAAGEQRRRRNRSRTDRVSRELRLNLRVNADELRLIEQAAERAGLTPTGYAAAAAVSAAHAGNTPHLDELRAAIGELAQTRTAVNRIGTNLNQAVAALNATGEAPEWLGTIAALCGRTVDAVDDAIAQMRKAAGR